MDDNINRRLPFGLDKDKLAPPTSQTTDINEVKKNVSKVIKSPFQKQKEEAEKKKKREQEEADAVYKEFVQSFSSNESKGKMFVRGETIMQTEKGLSVQHAVDNREYKLDAEITKREVPTTSNDAAPITGKKRTIDAFMEELKKQEEEKERRKFAKGPTGARIEHAPDEELLDATSTNIFLGNLSLQVTEEILRREFSVYGTVVSVKVLWPKAEEEKKKARNSGFVQFATRGEAERAMEAMRDREIMGQVPRLGWGRAPKHQSAPPTHSFAPPTHSFAPPTHSFAPPPSLNATAPPPWAQGTASAVAAPQLIVVPPSEESKRQTADRLAQLVVTHGQQFEQQLVERYSQHPKLSFLFQNGTNDNLYYRWRVYSLLQGDTLETWRATPFMMFVGGPLWVPPAIPDPFQFDWAAFAKRFRTKPLLPRDLSEWKSQLERLSLSRLAIRDSMVFAVERADSAAELVRVLSESVLVATNNLSPVLAIARLWLISDILHNSTAGIQHGSQFRAGFQETLPIMFEALHAKYKTFTSRIMAQNFKDPIMKVLKVWQDWSLYPPDMLEQLRGVFVRDSLAPATAASAKTVPHDDDDDVDGVPL